ncbi:MAG: catechol 2,3-dioxygenase [Treponema sp.]|nr:catechol 2,3-dioxygenase [Treponema sp.]
MAISKTTRPGLIQLKVLDMDKSLPVYRDVVGLDEVGKTSDGRVMLKCYDEFDHHSVVLRKADTAGLDYVAFKVICPKTLEAMVGDVEKFGYKVTEVPPNTDQPGFGKMYKFTICTGHEFRLYADVELAKDHPQIKNPNLWNKPPKGMRPTRLDHFLLYGPGIAEAERFCQDVLGMFVPEVVNAPDGSRVATWLSGTNKPHDVAFVENPKPGSFHHVGFYLQTWEDILNAADLIAVNPDTKLDLGPTRHAITRGLTIYFWEPSGNRIETYCHGYFAYPDVPQRVWDLDMLGKGLQYFSGVLIDSFLGVYT